MLFEIPVLTEEYGGATALAKWDTRPIRVSCPVCGSHPMVRPSQAAWRRRETAATTKSTDIVQNADAGA